MKTAHTILYKIQVGFGQKGAYKTRHHLTNITQCLLNYRCINIGNGFKKRVRISRDQGITWKTIHRTCSA
jgi:hypothetical protein